jgi:serine/threonine protein kinase
MTTPTDAERQRRVENIDFTAELESRLQQEFPGCEMLPRPNYAGAGSAPEFAYFRHNGKEYIVKIFPNAEYGEEGALHVRIYGEFQEWLKEKGKPARYLDHSPILPAILYVNEGVSRPFVVLERAAGGTMKEIIDAQEVPGQEPLINFRITKVRMFLDQMLPAFEFLTEKGYIHRDIKPDNIFLLLSGLEQSAALRLTSLADFGSAEALATSIVRIGTPPYMSPDALENRFNDLTSDAFSLAVILYQLLSGSELPFGQMEGFMTEIDEIFAIYNQYPPESPEYQDARARQRSAITQYIRDIRNGANYKELAKLPTWKAWIRVGDMNEMIRRLESVNKLDDYFRNVLCTPAQPNMSPFKLGTDLQQLLTRVAA